MSRFTQTSRIPKSRHRGDAPTQSAETVRFGDAAAETQGASVAGAKLATGKNIKFGILARWGSGLTRVEVRFCEQPNPNGPLVYPKSFAFAVSNDAAGWTGSHATVVAIVILFLVIFSLKYLNPIIDEKT